MKIKLDFVTNSSSSCFLISVPKNELEELENYIGDLNRDPDSFNEGVRIYMTSKTLKELQDYTNDGDLDWASRPGGPQFWNLEEKAYIKAKEALEKGNVVTQVAVDYNVADRFNDRWIHNILMVTD